MPCGVIMESAAPACAAAASTTAICANKETSGSIISRSCCPYWLRAYALTSLEPAHTAIVAPTAAAAQQVTAKATVAQAARGEGEPIGAHANVFALVSIGLVPLDADLLDIGEELGKLAQVVADCGGGVGE